MPETAPPAARRIALTGAAGSLAADVLPGLRRRGYELVCIDQRSPADDHGLTWVRCRVDDRWALTAAMAGCDAVVHLAGIPLEYDWPALLSANVDGTQAVLETARRLGIGKVVLASSIHAAGFVRVPPAGSTVPDDVAVRPNTFYGVTKAALEALGSLYADRHGMDVVCLRIASRTERPRDERMLSTWLSPADAVRLLDAALAPTVTGFHVVWGVSRNTRGYLSPAGGQAIGFFPEDDAEQHAADVAASDECQAAWHRRYIGGVFCSPTPPRFQPRTEEGSTAHA